MALHYLFQRRGGPLLRWDHGPPRRHTPYSSSLAGYEAAPVGRKSGGPEPLTGIGEAIAGSALVTILGGLFIAGFAYGSGKSLARRLIEK
jgi:hypothetical protein